MAKINVKNCITYVFIVLVVLPFFSSNVGINLGTVKINLSDIIIAIYLIIMLSKRNSFAQFAKHNKELRWWVCFLLLSILMVPIGLLNGAELGEEIRLIRNLLYIIVTYYFLCKNAKWVSITRMIEITAIISSLDCILRTYFLQSTNNWYQFYRANGVLNVFLFTCLVFQITTGTAKQSIVRLICCVGLGYSAFLSQERTQILTIGITCFIAVVHMILSKKHKISSKSIILSIIVLVFAIITIGLILRIEFVKNYVDYYVTYRLSGGKLFHSSGLSNDGSFQARLVQISEVLSNNFNPLYLFIGRGTCAHYIAAQGDTYIVDSTIIWSFKDFGLVGLVLLVKTFKSMLNSLRLSDENTRIAIITGGISLIVFSIYNPSFLYTPSAAFAFGLYSYYKYRGINNNELLNQLC